MARLTPDLIDTILLRQDLEFRTDFNTANHLLHSTICNTPEPDLIAAGENLIGSTSASRRILGIRLIRELKQFAEQAANNLAELLRQEQDDDVVYRIVGAFGFLRSDLITDRLISLAHHNNPGIRYHVATALANCASDEIPVKSVATLLELGNDINPEVRFSAVFELGTWWQVNHDVRIKAFLMRAADSDTDPLVVRTAREALIEGGDTA